MSWRRGRKGIPGGEQHLAQGPGVGNGQKVRRTSSPSVFWLVQTGAWTGSARDEAEWKEWKLVPRLWRALDPELGNAEIWQAEALL